MFISERNHSFGCSFKHVKFELLLEGNHMTVVYRLLRDDGDAFWYLLPCISGQLESLHSI